jgi:hypothetical protein
MDVLALLRSKNRCLERFLEVTIHFWAEAQDGKLENLAFFENQRESTLKAIDLFDRKLAQSIEALPAKARPNESLTKDIRAELDLKEALVHQILSIDLKIISKIEEARGQILKDLTQTRKGKESLSKFKSTWLNESGEELDQKL